MLFYEIDGVGKCVGSVRTANASWQAGTRRAATAYTLRTPATKLSGAPHCLSWLKPASLWRKWVEQRITNTQAIAGGFRPSLGIHRR